ncbi:MAG: zinc ribbon domain-containing protein [Saccharofermentans sp.]|nr:zinc ribbon domain-containing protein [Saccharofermentans sp.]
MPGFVVRFKTPTPVKFREKGCDTEFEVIVEGALYINDYDESAFSGTENDHIEAMKSMAVSRVEECLAHWHENGKTLYIDGKSEVELGLINMLKEREIDGSARINELEFTDEVDAVYQEQIMKPIKEERAEKRRQEIEAAVEPRGPLTRFSYNLSSHGMMAGTSSGSGREIEWNDDGSIVYTYSSYGGGVNSRMEYKIQPEIAQKVRDLVEEEKLAAISKLDIETPAMFDNFTSSSICMTFDDSSVGGNPCNMCSIQCGAAGMTFKKYEDKITALFEEIEASGECIKNETHETKNGFMGMGMLGMMTMNNTPPVDEPVHLMGLVPADPGAAKREAELEKWTCKCGTENSGKFCAECGEPKPAIWKCGCGADNTGKFCYNCGSPKPDGWTCECGNVNSGKYCMNCGKAKPE